MNKKITLAKLSFIFLSVLLFGCQEVTDVPPGVSIDSGEIKTFAGDTISFRSTVSDELGLKKITISCEEWSLNKDIDLSSQKPRVFNINNKIIVPQDAGLNFSLNLKLEILSISGKKTEKTIPVAYLPDTETPVWNGYASDMSVNFNTQTGVGICNMNLNLTDNRGLVSAVLTVPALNYTKTSTLTGKSAFFSDQINFTSVGTYPATLTVKDLTGNALLKSFNIIVLPVEAEDPISNYTNMYCIIADANPSSYIIGYYKPMTKSGDYQYTVKVYADHANSKIAFVPTRSITGDYFGTSPYVTSKLMNKNGYVKPVTLPVKGYYTVSIDILKKTYSVVSWTPTGTNIYASQVCMYANNDIGWGAWVASPVMTPDTDNSFIVRGSIPITGATDVVVQWFCFATSSWSMIWRPDGDSPTNTTGWYGTTGGGKSLNITSAGAGNYPVIFDMAPTIGTDGMWVTIKKP